MLTYRQTLDVSPQCFEGYAVPANEVLYFDIETTGLSADSSFLYLICVGFLEEGKATLCQWFSEGVADERNLLHAFFSFLQRYRVLVHYNGSTFDLPYLEKKCRQHHLTYEFSELCCSVDLYRMIKPHKALLMLPGCRQKDIEHFLGIRRKDKFDGGQLIEIYKQYLGRARFDGLKHSETLKIEKNSGLATIPPSPSEALLYVLLLHNSEDVEGLMRLSCLLPLLQLLNGCVPEPEGIRFTETELVATFSGFEPVPAITMLFSKEPLVVLPLFSSAFTCKNESEEICDCPTVTKRRRAEAGVTLTYADGQLTLHIPYFIGELKYYLDNYKDYYYLPDEDCAMHKSVAAAIDKSRRKSATAANCYIKKKGVFLPLPAAFAANESKMSDERNVQLGELIQHTFKQEKKSSICWFERSVLEECECDRSAIVTAYITVLLNMK